MSQQRSRADGGQRGDAPGRRRGRLVLAACLLALAAVGLRGTVPRPALSGSFRHDGLVIAVAGEAVLACLMIALVIRRSRAPDDAIIAERLRRLLTYTVVIALIAIPVVYLLDIAVHVHLAVPRLYRHGTQSRSAPVHVPRSHLAGDRIVIIVLLVLAAAVVIYLLARFIAAYRGTWTGWRRGAASATIEPSADDEQAGLREAVESGRSALRRFDDARAAIIACYVAMEQALARAGTSRAAADTPGELLARAAGQGLIRTDAAARLTELFYEARFSSHPVPPARRDDAQQALAELAASLADPDPDPDPAAGAGAGTGTGAGG